METLIRCQTSFLLFFALHICLDIVIGFLSSRYVMIGAGVPDNTVHTPLSIAAHHGTANGAHFGTYAIVSKSLHYLHATVAACIGSYVARPSNARNRSGLARKVTLKHSAIRPNRLKRSQSACTEQLMIRSPDDVVQSQKHAVNETATGTALKPPHEEQQRNLRHQLVYHPCSSQPIRYQMDNCHLGKHVVGVFDQHACLLRPASCVHVVAAHLS
eukprot:2148164-Pleurochrysis_carterae.AAC.1